MGYQIDIYGDSYQYAVMVQVWENIMVQCQLKRVRLWLLIIHCVNQRLELAVKDCLREDPAFTEVSEVLLALYYLTRNSGKVKLLLTKIALQLDVVCVAFVKSEGTRFQNHKYRSGV